MLIDDHVRIKMLKKMVEMLEQNKLSVNDKKYIDTFLCQMNSDNPYGDEHLNPTLLVPLFDIDVNLLTSSY